MSSGDLMVSFKDPRSFVLNEKAVIEYNMKKISFLFCFIYEERKGKMRCSCREVSKGLGENFQNAVVANMKACKT